MTNKAKLNAARALAKTKHALEVARATHHIFGSAPCSWEDYVVAM
jgi:hypothetical protein